MYDIHEFLSSVDKVFTEANILNHGNFARVPKGYKLVEDEDHKTSRLKAEIEQTKTIIETYEKYVTHYKDKLADLEKQLAT